MPACDVVKISPESLFPAIRFLCVLAALIPGATRLGAQAPYPKSSKDFQSTVQHAAVIFDGTVTAVQCEFGKGKLPQTYRISFQVKQGVRGVPTGSTYTLREWAGLWPAGQKPRYRVGERRLLFLYSPGSTPGYAGLTSPVLGNNGKLAIVTNAAHQPQVSLPPEWQAAVGQPAAASLKTDTSTAPKASPSSSTPVPEAWLLQRIALFPPAGGK